MSFIIKDWVDYWNKDDLWSNLPLWETNNRIFLQGAEKIVQLSKKDTVLNIGCGSGYLEAVLAPKVNSILAVDVSEQFVKMCKERCRSHDNVSVELLDKEYTNFNIFKKSFSLIFCISVIQYYKSMNEVELLIRSASSISEPGGRMLIADIPMKRNNIGFIWDAICSVLMSIKKGYFLQLLNAVYAKWIRNRSYNRSAKQIKQIYFDKKEIASLIKRTGINAKVVNQSLSVYANRPSLLIHF